MKDSANEFVTRLTPGEMYMYYYDAKYKDTLPFWDRFPLIFPFRVKKDRFWALNLHYLPPQLRAAMMDSLYDFKTNDRYDESTKLKFSWKALNAMSGNKYFAPCVKQYLLSHVQSKFVKIPSESWDTALFLPTEKFSIPKSTVWSSSRSQLGIRRS